MARGGSRYGAGRPGWHAKAEHCLQLDVRDLARRKMLRGGTFSWRWTNTGTGKEVGSIGVVVLESQLALDYSIGGEPRKQYVEIERTACNYGGTRPWFRCPRCDRRVAVLYLRSGSFVCRHCGSVVYGCQSEDAMGRAWRLQRKLEKRLGENGQREKGMHATTRERILQRIVACEVARDVALCNFMRRLGLSEF